MKNNINKENIMNSKQYKEILKSMYPLDKKEMFKKEKHLLFILLNNANFYTLYINTIINYLTNLSIQMTELDFKVKDLMVKLNIDTIDNIIKEIELLTSIKYLKTDVKYMNKLVVYYYFKEISKLFNGLFNPLYFSRYTDDYNQSVVNDEYKEMYMIFRSNLVRDLFNPYGWLSVLIDEYETVNNVQDIYNLSNNLIYPIDIIVSIVNIRTFKDIEDTLGKNTTLSRYYALDISELNKLKESNDYEYKGIYDDMLRIIEYNNIKKLEIDTGIYIDTLIYNFSKSHFPTEPKYLSIISPTNLNIIKEKENIK